MPQTSVPERAPHLLCCEPPQCLLLALLAMVTLHVMLPIMPVVPRAWFWGCAAIAVLGIVVGRLAFTQMRRNGIAPGFASLPPVLLTGGCYRYSRHPMYMGMALLLLGEATMLGSLGALLPLPVFMLAMHARCIRDEERRLNDQFGPRWLDYRRRVRAWI